MAQSSIFESLSKSEAGKGKITIIQSSDIKKLVGPQPANDRIEVFEGKSYLVVQGYRIQVFSGNNQRKSKDEADHKERQIKKVYTDISTHVTFMAPFWRLCVGDYLTYEEAYAMMQKLIESFPSFKKEIHVIKEDIRIPLD